MLTRCPVPDRCGRTWPRRWHISAAGRAACLTHQREKQEDLIERQRKSVIEAGQRIRDRAEQRRNDDQEKLRDDATAAHAPVKPTHPKDEVLVRNGESQLMALDPHQLRILGLLLSVDVYGVNEELRKDGDLAQAGGLPLDDAGYESVQQFVDDACGVFEHLGSRLDLDEQLTVFRGIGLHEDPDEWYPDIAGISSHLTTETPWHQDFTDKGFAFAATDPQTALSYNGSGNAGPQPAIPVLLELTVRRGLCLPKQEHRSTPLIEHTFDPPFLDTTIGQVIFPLGTRWKVLSVEKDSPHGVPLVRMKQLISAPANATPPV